MARIYTLVNQKGGVGKTTTAINLGSYLSRLGQRVLIVDIDPQANATSSLGIDKHSVQNGSYRALLEGMDVLPHILYSQRLGLSLLPSSPMLAGAEVELVDMPNRERRLRASVLPLGERYDYILIDCPPSLGLLTLNGMLAAENGLLIPVQCEYLALEGLSMLTQTIERVRSSVYPSLSIRGVILTMFDARTVLARDVVAEVRRYFPNQVLNAIVPRSIRLAEAPSYGIPISMYDAQSSGAQAYEKLARELLAGDGVHSPIREDG